MAFAVPLVPVADVDATYPGLNGKLLFASTRDGGDLDVFSMHPDGSNVTNLTSDSSSDDRLAAFSPDGTRVAYSSQQGSTDLEIMVMNADGSGKTQLTDNSVDDQESVFSPDGTQLAFGSQRDGGDFDVFVMEADGTNPVNLTPASTGDDYGPSYSPDGTQLAFTSTRDGNYEIYVMDADGSDQTRLTNSSHQDVDPEWAPDGSTLLFRRDFGNGSGWGETMRVEPNGNNLTNLTNTASIWEDGGHYSPDGSRIVFPSNEAGDFEVWIMDADGSNRTGPIAAATGGSTDVDWGVLSVGAPIDNEERRVTDHAFREGAHQDRSDIGGDFIVWRDLRGNSATANDDEYLGRVWSKRLTSRAESPVSPVLATDDPNPRVSGGWAVWTDHSPDPDGGGAATSNDDIYACLLPCTSTPIQVTTNSAHQMNPAIEGNVVVWEDYRSGNVDIFKKQLPGGAEQLVTNAAGDQVSPSIARRGGQDVVAWRQNTHPSGSDEANVFVKVGSNAPVLVPGTSAGNARSLSEYQVAVSATQVMWNTVDTGCTAPPHEGDPEDPLDDFDPCTLPRALRVATFDSKGVTGAASTVDTVPSGAGGGIITDLDLSGARGVWSKSSDSSAHTYTRDPIASGLIAPVDDVENPLGGFASGVRVDAARFTWAQQVGGPTARASEGAHGGSDIFWRDVGAQPRRANSLSLGGFGFKGNAAADGDLVVYRRMPLEHNGTAEATNDYQLWATDLTASGGERRHFPVAMATGTDFSRPAIVGDRLAWSQCASGGVSCGPIFGTTVAGPEPGETTDLSQIRPPDADGALTAWRCGDTEICVRSEDTGEMQSHDVSEHLFAAATADADDFSVLSDTVKVAAASDGRVVWHEQFFDLEESCDDCDNNFLHVLDLGSDPPTDLVIADRDSQASGDFDISYPNVVWAEGDIWRADLEDSCTNATDCPEQLVSHGGAFLTGVSIDGTRLAWTWNPPDELCCASPEIYTTTIGELEFHLVTNEPHGFIEPMRGPYVDGDRIYWEAGGDVFVESATGAALPAGDTTPPDPVTATDAIAFSGGIEVSWTNPTTDDFFRVRVLRANGATAPGLEDASGSDPVGGASAAVVYEGSASSFTDTDVRPGQTYTYSVFAFDYEPNFASPSPPGDRDTVTAT